MKTQASEFLTAHGDSWIAKRAAEFSIVNVHVGEVGAPPERIFPLLGDHELLVPGWRWKFLFGVRGALGQVFHWDTGITWHRPEPLAEGSYYAFFRLEHVRPPRELGMSVGNKLTGALMDWYLVPSGSGSRVFNVTCANFPAWQGRAYWRIIRPFHDALIEDSLSALRQRAEPR